MEDRPGDELRTAVFGVSRRDADVAASERGRRERLQLHYAVIDYLKAVRDTDRKAQQLRTINNEELNTLNRPVDMAEARIKSLMYLGNVDPSTKTREDWSTTSWKTGKEIVIQGRTALDIFEWLRDRSGNSYRRATYGIPAYEMKIWASNYSVDAPTAARRAVKA